ncbi:phosphodiesterase [Shewanella schlegeliana]|uniref:Phosphoesterase n=1 Tax=Shewanella schlegeliana TaxID=190308 RepID=A0ABS1T5H2_9GAMM|nr:phosphodiesterase [Shewanella schlegeliana]MBL4914751.1 phosphodiesterase [Shewanella schlegeliana]MCL1109917.1 phosphodiesterase [Shewanella schlegeliana]GIU25664.1 phosphoesterase [Shewanella schlegeliana]
MKLFIASDLHGSLSATQAMLTRFEQSGASYLILLGDLLNHGPRNAIPEGYAPAALADTLNTYADKIIAVRGNCDSEVDQMLLQFPITETCAQVLMPQMRLFLTHGHVYGPDKRPPLQAGDALLYGHTHIAVAEYRDDILLFNPGSTTIPRNDGRASYGLITPTECQVRAIDNDELLLSCPIHHRL